MAYNDPTFIAGLANLLLAQVVTYFAPVNTDVGAPVLPDRRFVSGLEPAWDSEQLVVWVNAAQPPRSIPSAPGAGGRMPVTASESGPQERFGAVLAVTFLVDLLRPYPQIALDGSIDYGADVPSINELNTNGTLLLTDLWTILYRLQRDQQINMLFGATKPIASPQSTILPVQPLGPASDLAGYRFSFTISGA